MCKKKSLLTIPFPTTHLYDDYRKFHLYTLCTNQHVFSYSLCSCLTSDMGGKSNKQKPYLYYLSYLPMFTHFINGLSVDLAYCIVSSLFNFSYRADLLVMNSHSFCLPDEVLIPPCQIKIFGW